MLVSVHQWCADIGTFSYRYILITKGKTVVVGFGFWLFVDFFVILDFCYIFLTHGDIEVNPEPKKNCSTSFSVNSLTVHKITSNVLITSVQQCLQK